jgi:hypothetical protein
VLLSQTRQLFHTMNTCCSILLGKGSLPSNNLR